MTRDLASRGVGLHPLVCLLEEAHVVFQHPTYGAEACQLACSIVKLCRKRGIHLIVSTQAPTATSVPRDVTRNCSNGIAFAVGDHVANDGLLGEGAYKSGHRATELIPGTDRGTAVVRGFTSAARSQTVQVLLHRHQPRQRPDHPDHQPVPESVAGQGPPRPRRPHPDRRPGPAGPAGRPGRRPARRRADPGRGRARPARPRVPDLGALPVPDRQDPPRRSWRPSTASGSRPPATATPSTRSRSVTRSPAASGPRTPPARTGTRRPDRPELARRRRSPTVLLGALRARAGGWPADLTHITPAGQPADPDVTRPS